MEKEILIKRLEARAEEEVRKEWRDFVNYCANHPLGKTLKVGGYRLFAGANSGHMAGDILSYWYDDMFEEGAIGRTNAHIALERRKQEILEKKNR